MAKKPSNNRPAPAPSRPSGSKPSSSKPSSSKPSASKPSASKPSASKPSPGKATTNSRPGATTNKPAANPGTTQAPSWTNDAISSAIDTQWNSGLNIGRDFYNSESFQKTLNENLGNDKAKMSEQDVARYAMSKGYGLGDQYQNEFGKAAVSTPRKAENLRQAIKMAAVNDGIVDRKEGRNLFKEWGDKKNLNAYKLLGIMDSMNSNFDQKGRQAIGVNGHFMNGLQSGKFDKNKGDSMWASMYDNLSGGKGGLTGIYRGMGDSWKTGGAGDGAETRLVPGTGKFARGDALFGQYSTGQFKDSAGLGRGWGQSKWATPAISDYSPFAERTGDAGAGAGDGIGDGIGEEVIAEEKESNPSMNQGGYGDDTANWATSWRGKKSTRGAAGRRGQGTGSMTNRGPATKSWGVGANFG